MALPHLFSPISIGKMALRNRLVMSPMETCYADLEGLPSEQYVAYIEARAKGGVGLITLGACTVDADHREVPNSIHFASDDVIDAHARMTERVHAAGAKIQPQIVHPGPDSLAPLMSGKDSVGPSIVPSYLTGTPCRALDRDEIVTMVELYRSAARRVRAAGYDGIELHSAHGYMLLGSFLTSGRNRRNDEYGGGTTAGRIRLIREVLAAIKEAAGDDFPVTLRISGYERAPDGRSSYDTQRIAPALVAAGVDAFHVSGGVIDRLTTAMVAGSAFSQAHNLAAAAAVKQVVDVPVMVVGRIHDPLLAESILAEGSADLVVMGRPMLADPDLPNKARSGRLAEIRPCISCENCIDSMETMRMRCAVNASTGRETEWTESKAATAKRVMIVGGGPGGLEAARVAASRGHRVVLFERGPSLGGALRMAATVHPDNEKFLNYLLAETARLPIDVKLKQEVSAQELAVFHPDAVIVATGGKLVTPTIPGSDHPHVVSAALLRRMLSGNLTAADCARVPAWQRLGSGLLGGPLAAAVTPERIRRATNLWMPLGRRVAVIGTDLAAVELAEFLAERGRRVFLLGAEVDIAPEVGLKRRTEHMMRLDQLGVAVNTEVVVERIDDSAVLLRLPEGGLSRVSVDSVVLAGHIEADASLFEQVRLRVPEAYAVGDCTGLGLIRKAVEDGARAARQI
jgi:2,4-dienoyl-CoA reductase (NADPH2)